MTTVWQVTHSGALQAWIASLKLKGFDTDRKLAHAAGLSESAFSRQIKAGKLGVKPLLKLALATGEPATLVLEKAGKHDLAALIESCYGAPRPVPPAIRDVVSVLERHPDLAPIVANLVKDLVVARPEPGQSGTPPLVPQAAASDTRLLTPAPKRKARA